MEEIHFLEFYPTEAWSSTTDKSRWRNRTVI